MNANVLGEQAAAHAPLAQSPSQLAQDIGAEASAAAS